jgi:hypothetical protein
MEKGVMEDRIPPKMDIVATEAMLQEANINNKNARILFWHLRQFFGGRSYFESEQKHSISLAITTSLQHWTERCHKIRR